MERLVVAVTSVEVRSQDASILAVSLADGSLLFYRQGALLERLHAASPVVAMASGRFGREDACLVMVTRGIPFFAFFLYFSPPSNARLSVRI